MAFLIRLLLLITFTNFFTLSARADVLENFLQVTCMPELDYFKIETMGVDAGQYSSGSWLYNGAKKPDFKKQMWEKYGVIADTGGKPFSGECALYIKKMSYTITTKENGSSGHCPNTMSGKLKLWYGDTLIFDGTVIDSCGDNQFAREIIYHSGKFSVAAVVSDIYSAGKEYGQTEYSGFFYMDNIENGNDKKVHLPITDNHIYKGCNKEELLDEPLEHCNLEK